MSRKIWTYLFIVHSTVYYIHTSIFSILWHDLYIVEINERIWTIWRIDLYNMADMHNILIYINVYLTVLWFLKNKNKSGAHLLKYRFSRQKFGKKFLCLWSAYTYRNKFPLKLKILKNILTISLHIYIYICILILNYIFFFHST